MLYCLQHTYLYQFQKRGFAITRVVSCIRSLKRDTSKCFQSRDALSSFLQHELFYGRDVFHMRFEVIVSKCILII